MNYRREEYEMKILVTGFDPFGGEPINPALEAVKGLAPVINGAEVIQLEIPTVFGKAAEVVKKAIEEHQPDVVLNIGQAVDVLLSRQNELQLILMMLELRIMKAINPLMKSFKQMEHRLTLLNYQLKQW